MIDPEFEILSLGDAQYLYNVVNAVAGFDGYATLGAIGALVGLILMTVQGVTANGGPKLELQWLLISIITFYAFFVARVDEVLIVELNTPPGYCHPVDGAEWWQQGCAPRTYVVDNVPLGLAATGYIVSNVGVAISSVFETTFGSVDDTHRVSTGAVGQSLRMLTQLRKLQQPGFTDPEGELEYVRRNLKTYMHDCTLVGVQSGNLTKTSVLRPEVDGSSAIPALQSIRYAHTAWTTTLLTREAEGFGSKQFNCATGWDHIRDTLPDNLEAAFMRALASDKVVGQGAKPITQAFANMTSEVAMNSQAFVMANMVAAVASRAALAGPPGSDATSAIIMIEEAAAKRAVQSAGEESIFVRLLRPTVSFFETMFYALAPIMAFLIATGQFGLRLAAKYLQLTIWVTLWFPLLAIINLFTNTQMKSFIDALGDQALSPLGAWSISTAAIDYLGVASTMAAATPALAMALMYGGVYAMTNLANRIQGSDMIDESKLTPDATRMGAGMDQSSILSSSMAGGVVKSGASMPTLTSTHLMQANEQAQSQELQQDASNLSRATSQTVKEMAADGKTSSSLFSAGYDLKAQESFAQAVKYAVKEDAITADQATVLTQLSHAEQARFAASVGLKEFGTGANTEYGALATGTDTETYSTQALAAIGDSLTRDNSATAGFTRTAAMSVMNSTGDAASIGVSAEDATTLSSLASNVVSSSDSYLVAHSLTESSGMSENIPINEAFRRFEDTGGSLEQLMRHVDSAGLNDEYKDSLNNYQNMHGLVDPGAQRFGALTTALENGNVQSDKIDDRAGGLQYLTSHVFMSGETQNAAEAEVDAGYIRGQGYEERVIAAGDSVPLAVGGASISRGQVYQDASTTISAAAEGRGIAVDEVTTQASDRMAGRLTEEQASMATEGRAEILQRQNHNAADNHDEGHRVIGSATREGFNMHEDPDPDSAAIEAGRTAANITPGSRLLYEVTEGMMEDSARANKDDLDGGGR